jgi:hypothetical protein
MNKQFMEYGNHWEQLEEPPRHPPKRRYSMLEHFCGRKAAGTSTPPFCNAPLKAGVKKEGNQH